MSVQLHARRCPEPAGDRSLEVALRQLAITEEQVRGLLSLGRVGPRPRGVCDLRRLVADVAELVHPSAEHAGVSLRHDPAGPPLPLAVDVQGLRAAVLNLALNAVEAAGRGGSVSLGVEPDGREVAVAVADDGPGPPAALAGAIGEAFVTGKPEGVGLGLALAQQVAAEHGGRLAWGRDGGLTRFRLALPRGPSTAPGGRPGPLAAGAPDPVVGLAEP